MAPLLESPVESRFDLNQLPSPQGGASQQKNILYIDAYDSFSNNVVAMLEETLDVRVTVMTIDSEWPHGNMEEFLRHYEAVVLGPGPGNPEVPADVGIMTDVWDLDEMDLLPVLGICMGFQSLCLRHGCPIRRLPYPLHGQVRQISTVGRDIFDSMQEVEVTLYNSLYAEVGGDDEADSAVPKSNELDLLSWLFIDKDSAGSTRIPMAVRHKQKPFWGVQFHPESCKSDGAACRRMLKKWWDMALDFNKRVGRETSRDIPQRLIIPSEDPTSLPDAAFTMLKWSVSASGTSAFRSLSAPNVTSEIICELLNAPGSAAVLFQSNGRYIIVSAPGPGSWRLEYFAQARRLVLENLGYDCKANSLVENRDPKETMIEEPLSVAQLWDCLRYLMEMKKVTSGNALVPFWGGFLGYFSYEMGLACLSRPKTAPELYSENERLNRPNSDVSIEDPADTNLLWTERNIVIDNETGQVTIQSTREEDNLPNGWLDQILQSLTRLFCGASEGDKGLETEAFDSILKGSVLKFPDEKLYMEQVEACKVELKAGESYELCLTCETPVILQSPKSHDAQLRFPWDLYKRLKKYNPAAFSAYARLGKTKIVSSSPECFLNWDRESTLEMKPMKGTVRKSKEMTMKKARDILSSSKEMAENLMIADLIRHDLYGICGSRQVHVEKLLEVEDHGRVFQMITHVKGKIDHHRLGIAVEHMPQLQTTNMSVHGLTALQRCLPPGSMTGAPKERSCMHLSSIEGRKRGIYSGVMGYLDLGGGGSFSVLIRTAFSCSGDDDDEQVWRIGAGGAVTSLSTAEGEWDEMLTKLRTVCTIFRPLDSKNE